MANTTGRKYGGRTKGTPNKKTQEILALIEDTGCMHPITGLAKIAQQTYDEGDFATSMGAFKELAQYVAPKRKAIEHSGEIETKDPFVIVVQNPEGQ
jgi:hypothetical protein